MTNKRTKDAITCRKIMTCPNETHEQKMMAIATLYLIEHSHCYNMRWLHDSEEPDKQRIS